MIFPRPLSSLAVFCDVLVCYLVLAIVTTPAWANYDEVVASRAMFHSAAAYCDPLALQSSSCGVSCGSNIGVPTVRHVAHITSKDLTYGYVTYNSVSGTIVVAFRGTNGLPTSPGFRSMKSFHNWQTNLDFHQVSYCDDDVGAKVHDGFMSSYSTLAAQVRSSVSALLKSFPKARVLVTGHSLGGALATLCAADLKMGLGDQLADPDQVLLYTFGSPRVGNAEFAAYFNSRLFPNGYAYRVVQTDDAVAHVPSLLHKFVHIGQEIWYHSADNAVQYRECATGALGLIYEDPTCSDALPTYGIDAHMVYLAHNITDLCPIACPPNECLGYPVDASTLFERPSSFTTVKGFKEEEEEPVAEAMILQSKSVGDPVRDLPCPNCDSYGCNDKGICNNYCVDARKWWGPSCTNPCIGNCDSYGCNKGTGMCNNYCSDAKLWWGPHCDQKCIGNCDSYGCNKGTGMCNNYCSDAKLWWGPQCDKPCIGHCDSYGCNKGSGLCNNYCSDAKLWWGPQCDKPCMGHCDSYGCNKGTGLCNNYCSDPRLWWGDQCDQKCMGNCDSYGCNKRTGWCNNNCNGKWWGPHCENSCAGCERGCNRNTGACM